MAGYAVWEAPGEGLGRRLERLTGRRAGAEGAPDVLILSPGAARSARPRAGRCRSVLLPGTAAALLEGIRAAGAVSYGTSPRDSVALASRDGERLAVSLQRELVRPDGAVVERQELILRADRRLDGMMALALAGALLLLGTEPGELDRFYLA